MRTLVKKFGGSSVSDIDKLRQVAERVAESHRQGYGVVTVVSAMGDTTNDLLSLATQLNGSPAPRELDLLLSSGERITSALLAMAVQRLGIEAVALTGPQSGIRTDSAHGKAQVIGVDTDRLRAELERGRVVTVAGFQGANGEQPDEITTLGRGGSDTSAVALAAALDAEQCEIYSDVDGVYSADPRVVRSARRLQEIDYEDMYELARHGARVLHGDAVRLAHREGLPIRARSTFGGGLGTLVRGLGGAEVAEDESADALRATGVASRKELLTIAVDDLDRAPAVRGDLSKWVGDNEILADQMRPGQDGVDFVLSAENLPDASALATHLRDHFGDSVGARVDVGSVAAVGPTLGVASHSSGLGLADHVREVCQQQGIPTLGSFVAARSVSCVLPLACVDDGLRCLHREFVEDAA